MKHLLFAILLLISTTFSFGQNATIFMSATDCSTWDCNPCDGTVTVWLQGATLPATYSFVITDNGGFTDTMTVVNDTIVTFTGLCAGTYFADSFWPAQGNPGAPVNPIYCTNCSPTGGGGGNGGGGNGASATVGAPDPILEAELSGGMGWCCWDVGAGTLTINGEAPPFQYLDFYTGQWVPCGSSTNFWLDCNTWGAPTMVMDATGQTATVSTANFSMWGCNGQDNVVVPSDMTFCSGDVVPQIDFMYNWSDCFGGGGGYTTVIGDATTEYDSNGGLQSIGGSNDVGQGSIPSFIAGNVLVPTTVLIYVSVPNSTGCGISGDYFNITVLPAETVDAGMDLAVCDGDQVTLSAISSSTFTWDNGIIDGQAFVPTQTTTYTVTTNGGGCIGSDQVVVTVNPVPNVDAGLDLQLCDGEQAVLSGSGAQTYIWDNGVIDGQLFVPPIGITQYSVSGSNAYGCSNTDNVQIEVLPNATIDAGIDQSVCFGQNVTLAASGGTNYLWDNGVTDNMPFTPGVGTLTYSVYDPTACSDTDYVDVTVYDLPIVNAGPDQVLCDDGSQITLSGSGAQSYSWDNGVLDGQAFSQIVGTTTYTVSGTDANGCVSTDQVDVTVNPLPSVDAGSDQILCDDGTQVVLAGSGAQSYLWDNGINDNIGFIQAPGTTTYVVIGTDNNGCTNSDTVDVTVNALPAVVAGPDVEVCEGTQVALSASGASSYVWDNGVTDGVAFLPPVGLTTYSVIGTDANGCKNTDQLNVLVHPTPSIDAGADQILCDNIPITLTAVGTGSYSWDNGVQDGMPFDQDVGIMTYTVTTVDAIGCTDADSVIVEVEEAPQVSFISSDTTGCIPISILFENTSFTTSSLSACVWNINGVEIEDCGPVWYTFDQSGDYNVGLSVTSATGCTSAMTSIGYISIEDDPIAAFTASESELLLWDTEVHFTNNSIGAVEYLWDFGDLYSSTDVNPSHVYDEENAHSYVVELIAYSQYGCTDTAYTIIQIREDLIYYVPNTFTPDGDHVNQTFKPIFYSGFDPYDYQLLIFDRWGELIFESNDPDIGWDGTYGTGEGTKHCQDGTYTWKLEFKTLYTDERKTAVGHVNLIR